MKYEANTSKPNNGGNDYLYSPQGGFCIAPNIGTTDQNDLGIQSNLPKASSVTNSEPRHNINKEVYPTKVLAGKGPPCHKSSSKSG